MKNGSIKNNTVKGIIWSFTDLLSRQGIQLFVQIILARLLLPEYFGLIGMITIFIAISQSLVQSGLDQALIREKQPTQEEYSTVFYFNLIISIIIYAVLYICAPFISQFFNEPSLINIIRFLMVIVIINAFGVIQRVILIREVDFKAQTKITIIAGIISGLIAIFLALNGFGVWSLVIQTMMMQTLEVVLLFIRSRWIPTLAFNYHSFKRFFNFGYKLLLSGLIDTFYKNIYHVIIGKYYSLSQLGYYTNAAKLVDVTSGSIRLAFNKVTYPVLSNIKDDEERLTSSYKKIIKLVSFLNFPFVLGLAAIAPNLIPFLLGDQWLPAVKYVQLLCLMGMLLPINGFNVNILKVKGRSDVFLFLEILRKVILSFLIFIAVLLETGIEGLIAAAILDSYISLYINASFCGREISYRFREQFMDIMGNYLNSVIMAIIVFLVGFYLESFVVIELFIQIFLGIFLYVILSYVTKSEELREIYSILRKNLRAMKN